MSSMNSKIEGFSKRTKIRARTYLKDLNDEQMGEIKNKDNSIVSKKIFSKS